MSFNKLPFKVKLNVNEVSRCIIESTSPYVNFHVKMEAKDVIIGIKINELIILLSFII